MNKLSGPIKVCVIDIERYPEVISNASGYVGMRALVRERGRPRGIIELPFTGKDLDRSELARAVAALPPAANAPPLGRTPGESLPRISVVIPSSLQRRALLDACLRSVAALDYPDYEVIVVDNRPAGSPRVELQDARVVREPHTGTSAARNRGLSVTTGEIVAFTDDDMEVDPAWLLAIALRLRAHPEEACVTGLTLSHLETPAQVALAKYYGTMEMLTFEPVSHRLRVPPTRRVQFRGATVDAIGEDGRCRRSFSLYATGTFGGGANMAFRAAALRDLGGFDLALGPGTSARGGEDLAVFAQLAWQGHGVGYEPAALVFHMDSHRQGDADLRRQLYSFGVGYTAMLTALVLDDPRHAGRMLGTAWRAARAAFGHYSRRSDPREQKPRNRELSRAELRGMATGPAAYLCSRRKWSC